MPYFIREKKLITLMMKLDCDIAVMTLDDLDNFYIKRSYVRKDVEYVYMFHHMTSTHLVATKEAYDHYDAIMCVGPHQKTELRRAEQMRGLPEKTLVECGYDLMDRQIADYAARGKTPRRVPSCSSLRRGRRIACSTFAPTRSSGRFSARGTRSSCALTPSTPSVIGRDGNRFSSAFPPIRLTSCTSSRTSARPIPFTTPMC